MDCVPANGRYGARLFLYPSPSSYSWAVQRRFCTTLRRVSSSAAQASLSLFHSVPAFCTSDIFHHFFHRDAAPTWLQALTEPHSSFPLRQALLQNAAIPPSASPHDVKWVALSQKINVGFAHHPGIHHPDPLRLSETMLDFTHYILHGGHVDSNAVKDLIVDRCPLWCEHKPDTHLLAIGSLIPL
jgi:hypothetical protein